MALYRLNKYIYCKKYVYTIDVIQKKRNLYIAHTKFCLFVSNVLESNIFAT